MRVKVIRPRWTKEERQEFCISVLFAAVTLATMQAVIWLAYAVRI